MVADWALFFSISLIKSRYFWDIGIVDIGGLLKVVPLIAGYPQARKGAAVSHRYFFYWTCSITEVSEQLY
jgi:hypothetical protein